MPFVRCGIPGSVLIYEQTHARGAIVTDRLFILITKKIKGEFSWLSQLICFHFLACC